MLMDKMFCCFCWFFGVLPKKNDIVLVGIYNQQFQWTILNGPRFLQGNPIRLEWVKGLLGVGNDNGWIEGVPSLRTVLTTF